MQVFVKFDEVDPEESNLLIDATVNNKVEQGNSCELFFKNLCPLI